MVTIKDIPKEAGVSHTTVSRALRNYPALSNQTIERIKNIAKEMGYVPSVVARGLRTNQSLTIGVIIPHIGNPACSSLLEGINDILQELGYALLVTTYDNDLDKAAQSVETLVSRQVDGLIFCDAIGLEVTPILDRLQIPYKLIVQTAVLDQQATYALGQHKATKLLELLRQPNA